MTKETISIKSNVLTKPIAYKLYFAFGIIGMSVSGYFLIRGFLAFGNGADSFAYILGGLVIQLIEGACFIGSVTSVHSLEFKKRLRKFGWFLFAISITLVTLAQQATSIRIDKQVSRSDQNRTLMADQIKENSDIIKGDLHNSKYQSKSIYKASRDTGTKVMAEAKESSKINSEQRQKLIASNNKEVSVSPSEAYLRLQGLIKKLSFNYFNPEVAMISLVMAILIAFCFEYGGILMLSYGASMYVNNRRILTHQAEKYTDYTLAKARKNADENANKIQSADSQNADQNADKINVRASADENGYVRAGADLSSENAGNPQGIIDTQTRTVSKIDDVNQELTGVMLAVSENDNPHFNADSVSANADGFGAVNADAYEISDSENVSVLSKKRPHSKKQKQNINKQAKEKVAEKKYNEDYSKVKKMIKSLRIKPSQRAILSLVGGRNDRANKMILQLVKENVIELYTKTKYRIKPKVKG